VKLLEWRIVQIEPYCSSQFSGFTPLFEALVLALAQQMTLAAVARLVDESWHRLHRSRHAGYFFFGNIWRSLRFATPQLRGAFIRFGEFAV